jgi:hypothetical protein
VTEEASRTAEQQVRAQREADLVAARIKELFEHPIQGSFDIVHLRAVHAYLFQDSADNQPGIIRDDTDGWQKARELEGSGPSHVVHYVHEGVELRIHSVLGDFGGPGAGRRCTCHHT